MLRRLVLSLLISAVASSLSRAAAAGFVGKHYRGTGDVEYLRLLETARRMFEPDAQRQNLAM